MSENDARLILGHNAVDCYRLDSDRLAAIADKIGPFPDEVLGEHTIDDRLLEQFHGRSGYKRPAEQVDPELYGRMITSDREAAAAFR